MRYLAFKKSIVFFLLLSTGLLLNAQASTDSFMITIKTDNTGSSGDTEFTIPTSTTTTYNYSVDCNSDGTYESTGESANYTCSYGVAGSYQITIDGTFPHIYFNNEGDKEKILSVDQWGIGSWSSMRKAFYGASNLVINDPLAPNLMNVGSTERMFS
ncbi:MAG: hypothetical protein DRG24_07350, partial [Epsilonproteobacteria bacterium]